MSRSLSEPNIGPADQELSGANDPEMKAGVEEILNRHPAVGLAVGVVRDGSLAFFYGHGVADIASGAPVTEDTVFRIGSITKTVTAIAVMQLWEQGLLDLDAPANDYLRGYKLVPAKATHRPATVRHLLTYTAGLPQAVHLSRAFKPTVGEMVGFGQRVPTLAEFYRGQLHLVAEPGAMHIYSNHGFATLGQIVEDASGEPLDRYFTGHVFEPLGMEQTDLLRSERVRGRLATEYALCSHGPGSSGKRSASRATGSEPPSRTTRRHGVTCAVGMRSRVPSTTCRSGSSPECRCWCAAVSSGFGLRHRYLGCPESFPCTLRTTMTPASSGSICPR